MRKLILLFSAMIFLSGCATQKRQVITKISQVQHYQAGTSVQNRPINYMTIGSGKDVVFYLAAIHGDEYQGTALMTKLAEHLQINPELVRDMTVVIMPQANPDGFVLKQRYNANHIDLNRNFPTDNRVNNKKFGTQPLCEPESKIIYDILQEYKPRLIISMHQSLKPRAPKPAGWIDYDGDAKLLAEKMSMLSGLDVYKYGAMPGSLGSYASTQMGVPIITFEQPYEIPFDPDKDWLLYKDALLAGLNYTNSD